MIYFSKDEINILIDSLISACGEGLIDDEDCDHLLLKLKHQLETME